MRILMLSELYPPHIGGTEQHVRNLSRGLVQRGHDVAVATIGGRDDPPLQDDEGVQVHRFASTTQRVGFDPSGRPYLPPFPDPSVTRALRRILATERPQVVHAHNWMVHSFLPLKRRSGARLVVTLHDYSNVCAKRDLLYRGRTCTGPGLTKCMRCTAANYGTLRGPLITIANWTMSVPLARGVDMFVPVSRFVAEGNELERRGRPHRVVPNFVPDDVADASDPAHPALAKLPDGPFWLYVGALSRHKGVHVLLDAYRGLEGAPPLVIIGRRAPDAPEDYPDNVILLTDVPHPAVMAAWARASLGIIPSLFPDPCPTVALEAMAAGVPLVGSRSGGLPDLVVEGETGLLVQPGSASALRAALVKVRDDDAARGRMAEAARKRAPEFMASNVISRIEDIYSELAG
jgi:glycosyltransferase involved in cell wall biosynthesis